MKKLVLGLLASLLFVQSLPAMADHHGHWHHYGPPRAPHHHHFHRGAPLAWMLGGVVLGSALISITAPRPVIAAPAVVVSPPQPIVVSPPTARTAWFCESYQAYYPSVPYCPEGWRVVVY